MHYSILSLPVLPQKEKQIRQLWISDLFLFLRQWLTCLTRRQQALDKLPGQLESHRQAFNAAQHRIDGPNKLRGIASQA